MDESGDLGGNGIHGQRLSEPSDEAKVAIDHRSAFDPEAWEQGLAQKKGMTEAPEVGPPTVTDRDLAKLEKNGVALVASDTKARVADVELVSNPDPHGSFGFVDPFVRVHADDTFAGATLLVRVWDEQLGPVSRETLRLFRWVEQESRFRKVGSSGVAEDGSYVWARIGLSGIYGVIGLHSDPFVLHAVKIFCSLGPYLSTLKSERRDVLQRGICELILCSPDLRQTLRAPGAAEALVNGALGEGAWQQSWPLQDHSPMEDVCGQCIGMKVVPLLPECELLPEGLHPLRCVDPGWIDVGPADIAGCVIQVITDPTDSDRLYAAAADGGVWRLASVASYPKTKWEPLTDQQPNLSPGSVAVAPSDGRVIYYNDALEYVYRSHNSGSSWTRPSGSKIGGVYKLVVHHSDPDTVHAATTTGLWFTGDGGVTWTNLNPGKVTDVAADPIDSSILYAAKPNVGLLKSYNSGLTWNVVLPWSASGATWPMMKVAVGARGNDLTRMVAAKLNEEVWVNRAGGRNGVGPTGWSRVGTLAGMGQWDWDHAIAVDPFDDNVILVGGQTLYRTANGGGSWMAVVQGGGGDPTHEDQQSIAFDPINQGVVYLSNDGGVWRSTDSGQTWATGNVAADVAARRNLNYSLVTAQFYRAGAAANRALGNVYHSGIIGSNSLASRSWVGVEGHGWEGANIYRDERRPTSYFVVAGTLGRHLWPTTGANDFLIPWGAPSFTPAVGSSVRSVAVDPRATSTTVLSGAHTPGRVMRGDGSLISPAWSAMPGISVGNEPIVSIDFARSAPGKAYAVSERGHLYVKDDVDDMVVSPAWTYLGQWVSPTGNEVRQIAVNPQVADRLYLITAQEIVRWAPSTGWTSIKGAAGTGLPSSDLHSIAIDPRSANVLYVGADIGVFVSRDDGANWYAFDQDLPNAVIGQIFWEGGYLYATTFGRGLWRRSPCP